MYKKIIKIIKLQIKGGLANPAPPIGPALGAAGVNIMDFCKKYNFSTQNDKGKLLPVIISIYDDKSFDFIIKKPPVSKQLLELCKIDKGSKESNKIKVGKITWFEIKNIAKNKIIDMNCFNIKSAISMVAGTARSMGIEILD
ncbi:50S ribosomal protein L11 [Candidatus Karelsulcia muelleri]|uniref:Large ribosomal subunit protein uL11 n=1 Tax=Candidatus Karelsulcia muelleri PSPU TaxID=1189303 RepID=A0AAD1EX96_9FLAO|nr:50S ribosomal protein L11 [Candidatus Karelsulcia muelleri]NJJ98841.1 50S ribosomal protein L11 [Candidatus Karelsulcia muelleri]BAO66249.1 50S ribosomal protein L11 [Candidatus Karelsulcia muelleri PSPU]